MIAKALRSHSCKASFSRVSYPHKYASAISVESEEEQEMEELDLELVAALGLPSPVEGVTREMLGKVGWVNGLPGRAIKIAHRPKVFRTPAPKYPRHRIRATWAVRGGEWVCLEDSADMAELENSKAELEEGVVMTITSFNLPKGEEEPVPDSDREADPPVGDGTNLPRGPGPKKSLGKKHPLLSISFPIVLRTLFVLCVRRQKCLLPNLGR